MKVRKMNNIIYELCGSHALLFSCWCRFSLFNPRYCIQEKLQECWSLLSSSILCPYDLIHSRFHMFLESVFLRHLHECRGVQSLHWDCLDQNWALLDLRLANVAKLKVIHNLIWYYFFKISIQIWQNKIYLNERLLIIMRGHYYLMGAKHIDLGIRFN